MLVTDAPSRPASYRPFIIMAVIALVATVWQHRAWRQESLSAPEYLAYLVVAPAQTVFSTVLGKLHDGAIAIVSAPRLVEENRRLREQRDELEAARVLYVETLLENKALREKLGVALDEPFDRIAARVIGRSSGRESRWIRIRAARGKSLEVGNVVREAKGLVGRVVEATGSMGRVVLLMDPQHAVRGRVLPSGDEGMIHAAPELDAGPNRLQFEKARRRAQVAVGDVIVTSDVGETYPGRIRIGEVESVQRSRTSGSSLIVYVKPFVDFEHLDHVYVLRAGEQ